MSIKCYVTLLHLVKHTLSNALSIYWLLVVTFCLDLGFDFPTLSALLQPRLFGAFFSISEVYL